MQGAVCKSYGFHFNLKEKKTSQGLLKSWLYAGDFGVHGSECLYYALKENWLTIHSRQYWEFSLPVYHSCYPRDQFSKHNLFPVFLSSEWKDQWPLTWCELPSESRGTAPAGWRTKIGAGLKTALEPAEHKKLPRDPSKLSFCLALGFPGCKHLSELCTETFTLEALLVGISLHDAL